MKARFPRLVFVSTGLFVVLLAGTLAAASPNALGHAAPVGAGVGSPLPAVAKPAGKAGPDMIQSSSTQAARLGPGPDSMRRTDPAAALRVLANDAITMSQTFTYDPQMEWMGNRQVAAMSFPTAGNGLTNTSKSPRFWDVPLRSATVAFMNDQQTVMPGPDDQVRVIVQFRGDPVSAYMKRLASTSDRLTASQVDAVWVYADRLVAAHRGFLSQIEQEGIQVRINREFRYLVNGLALSIKMGDWTRLEKLPQVKAVYPDYETRVALSESVPLIGAPSVWAMTDSNGLAVTGKGMRVAIIDTGVDYTHPDLGVGIGPTYKVITGYDFVNNDYDPMDDNGHGTHVAGIVAASGTITGVAPDASVLAYKVLDAGGLGWSSAIIAALERAADPDGDPASDDHVDIVNMSLGGEGDPDDPLSQAVDHAAVQGIVVVVAGGNGGPGYQTLGSPGVARQALTVAASDKSDQLAGFSSRGPVNGFFDILKPDITAPGVSIISSVPASGELGSPTRYRALNGTSMAAPHAAGAAALIKQLHPDWTPEMIKARLMNTAQDLGKGVFEQGVGRVDLSAAASEAAIIMPASLGLGMDDLNLPVWNVSKTLTLTNMSTTTANFSLTVASGLPAGIMANLSPSSTVLLPGESRAILFSLQVENDTVSNQEQLPCAYEGKIIAQTEAKVLRVPFAFIKSPSLSLSFDEKPWLALIHNRVNKSWFYVYPGKRLVVLLPQDTYDVMVEYQDAITRVFREGIVVGKIGTSLAISKAEAIHDGTISPVDQDGRPVYVKGGIEQIIHKSSKIGYLLRGGFIADKRFSDLSNAYSWEWAATTSGPFSNNHVPVYDFRGGANDGIHADIPWQNSPSDFKHVTYQYNVPPLIDQVFILHFIGQVGGFSVASFNIWEPPMSRPMVREAYFIPIPYPGFAFGYHFEEIYRYNGAPFDPWGADLLLRTPYMMAADTQTIEGYVDGSSTSVFSTTLVELPIGLTPPHWFGRFENADSEIRLIAAQGSQIRIFLNQLQDFRPHDNLPYELFKDGALVISGTLQGVGSPWLGPSVVSVPISSPGAYTLTVPYTYYLGTYLGAAHVTTGFDTRNSDRNPPYFTSLTIFNCGKVANAIALSCPNEIRFGVEDDVSLEQVSLAYNIGEGWQDLPLSLANNVYTASLSAIPGNSYVSLRIIAQDSQVNWLNYEMDPGFYVITRIYLPLILRAP